MKGDMKLVNTADIEGTLSTVTYARTPAGTIDYEAYEGLDAKIIVNKLEINVKIIKARKRFGHLDLLVIPTSGTGEVWVERKNIKINNDPALKAKPAVEVSTHKSTEKTTAEITLEMVQEFLAKQNIPSDKE
jgi:hypothetical protein